MDIKLVEIEIAEKVVETTNGRDLHSALGNKTQYNKWIVRALESAYLVENIDFTILRSGTSAGGVERKDYYLTIESAKSIAMMQRSQIGKDVRDYYIALEGATPATAPNVVVSKSPLELLNEATALANSYHEEMQVAKTKLLQIGEHLAGSVISELGENTTFNMAAKVFSSNLKINVNTSEV